MQEELKRIEKQMKFLQSGEAWHGKSLEEALDGLDETHASQVLFKGGHSIWELVLHIIAWRTFAIEKIKGNENFHIEIGGELDWPKVEQRDQASWEQACQKLAESNLLLRKVLQDKTDALLDQQVRGKSYAFYILLHGIVQHDAYHCGQIVLTRKMLEQMTG